MKNIKNNNGLKDSLKPFGSSDFDYDDDALEIYEDSFNKNLDKELQKISEANKKAKKAR